MHQQNEQTWGMHRKLNNFYKKYYTFKKQIDRIKTGKNKQQ